MSTAPGSVTVRGLHVPLIDTADGPRVDPSGELAGLAAVVNAFLNGGLPDPRRRLRDGEEVLGGGVFAGEVPAGLDLDQEGERWRRLAGSELGEDPVIVGSPATSAFVLPRSALLDILELMLDLRARAAEHASDDVSATAEAVDEPRASEPRADATQRILARTVANRPDAPGRVEELARLEDRARELDEMTDPAATTARRRTLLIELDGMGLLSGSDDVAAELRELGLPTLAGYHAAARRLLEYLASEERRAMLPDAILEPVLGAPVSLDFFRHGPAVPDGSSERGWTALGEALLAAASPTPTTEGEFYAQWDHRWYEVRWRRDDGNTPALLELQ